LIFRCNIGEEDIANLTALLEEFNTIAKRYLIKNLKELKIRLEKSVKHGKHLDINRLLNLFFLFLLVLLKKIKEGS